MAYKRLHARVPISGEAVLSNENGIRITTQTVDISHGGIGVVNPPASLAQADYKIDVSTEDGRQIQLTATLIHKGKQSTGFKTSTIDENNLRIIADLIAEFQTTDGFIEQIAKHDLLKQCFVDDEGNEVAVTFELD